MENSIDYFYNNSLRWSFGFENPNKAAVYFYLPPPALIHWPEFSLGFEKNVVAQSLLDNLCRDAYSRRHVVSL
jgi:hypothetical protein